jgi:hypothetical protein
VSSVSPVDMSDVQHVTVWKTARWALSKRQSDNRLACTDILTAKAARTCRSSVRSIHT